MELIKTISVCAVMCVILLLCVYSYVDMVIERKNKKELKEESFIPDLNPYLDFVFDDYRKENCRLNTEKEILLKKVNYLTKELKQQEDLKNIYKFKSSTLQKENKNLKELISKNNINYKQTKTF